MAVVSLPNGWWRVSLSRYIKAEFPPGVVSPGNLIPEKYIHNCTKEKQRSLSTEWREYCIDEDLDK